MIEKTIGAMRTGTKVKGGSEGLRDKVINTGKRQYPRWEYVAVEF